MARHEVIIHENPGLGELAPYTGNYISKETLNVKAFAEAVGAKCGLHAIQVISILGGSFEAIEALEREGLVRIHTDIGVICAVIKGSFPTADAAFDPERNSLELALRLDDAIRYDLSDVVPTIVTDESVTKLRVDNVMDLVEERPMNLIHGRHVFRVAGFNMVLSDEGATAYLQNALGTTFPLIIDEVVSKQLFKAHTAELLPAGDYKLVVKSRAGDAGGPLQTSFRKVKYLRVVDPVPLAQTSDGKCKVMSFKDGDSATDFTYGHDWTLEGSGLWGGHEVPTGEWMFGDIRANVDGTPVIFGIDESGISEDGTWVRVQPTGESEVAPGEYANVSFAVEVSKDGATETLTLTIPHLTVS